MSQGAHLTPIAFEEAVASLSAILLDDEYYAFIVAGRRDVDGLPWIGAEQLIPLKACAWLDLRARKAAGERIDSKDIRKHGNDVIRLSQLLAPDMQVPLRPRIAGDSARFLTALTIDESHDPRELRIDVSLVEIVDRIRRAYAFRSA